jgi:hypothetical protein
MNLKSTLERIVGPAFLLVLICGVNAGGGQIAFGQKRRSKSTGLEALSALTKPQLLNPDSNPTLRYPIANMSGSSIFSLSYGWFDVDHNGIRYTVVQPDKKKNESYQARFDELAQIKLHGNFLEFRHPKQRDRIFYLPENRWGSIHTGQGLMNASKENPAGTISIGRSITNFDQALAIVKPPPPPAPEISLRADPGTIEKGQAATLIWTSQNATTLDLEPGGGHVAAAGSTSVSPPDSTTYTLTATGPGGTQKATSLVAVTKPPPATPPTIILVEPSVASAGQTIDLKSSPLIIRGVVTDTSGIPAVNINGMPAALRPKSALAAEFFSDPIALQPGENKFEVDATNAARAAAKVTFTARYTPPPPPQPVEKQQPPVETNSRALDKAGILELLEGDVASERVADLVKSRGINFVPTSDDLKEIRAAGGKDDIIDAVIQAAAGSKK